MVKTLDPVIKEAFKKVGFSEEEVKDGCWLLERNNKAVALRSRNLKSSLPRVL